MQQGRYAYFSTRNSSQEAQTPNTSKPWIPILTFVIGLASLHVTSVTLFMKFDSMYDFSYLLFHFSQLRILSRANLLVGNIPFQLKCHSHKHTSLCWLRVIPLPYCVETVAFKDYKYMSRAKKALKHLEKWLRRNSAETSRDGKSSKSVKRFSWGRVWLRKNRRGQQRNSIFSKLILNYFSTRFFTLHNIMHACAFNTIYYFD